MIKSIDNLDYKKFAHLSEEYFFDLQIALAHVRAHPDKELSPVQEKAYQDILLLLEKKAASDEDAVAAKEIQELRLYH